MVGHVTKEQASHLEELAKTTGTFYSETAAIRHWP